MQRERLGLFEQRMLQERLKLQKTMLKIIVGSW